MRKISILLLLAAAAGCAGEKSHVSAPQAARTATATATAATPSASAEVGTLMPAYSGKYLDGKPLDLGREKGNVVFLNVWATWCGPCRFEIPELQELHQKYASRGFEVIGVSVDDSGASAVTPFVKNNKITYPIAVDPNAHIADVLHTSVLPTSVIIGRDGRIVWRSAGAMMPNDVPGVDAIIERALAAKS